MLLEAASVQFEISGQKIVLTEITLQ